MIESIGLSDHTPSKPESEPFALKQKNLAYLQEREALYGANPATQRKNSRKTFVPLVAGFGSGKSVISKRVTQLDPRIKEINSSVTRLRKDEDPVGFKTFEDGITSSWFVEQVRKGTITNFSVIPGVDAYGTMPEDFPGEFNVSPCLPSSLKHIERAGFKHSPAAFIVVPDKLWQEFVLESRTDLGAEKFKKRAMEAYDSANYALDHLDDFIFLENNIKGDEGITKIAQKVCDIAVNQSTEHGLPKNEAVEYLEAIKRTAQQLTLH